MVSKASTVTEYLASLSPADRASLGKARLNTKAGAARRSKAAKKTARKKVTKKR